jgi:hypothetical protein
MSKSVILTALGISAAGGVAVLLWRAIRTKNVLESSNSRQHAGPTFITLDEVETTLVETVSEDISISSMVIRTEIAPTKAVRGGTKDLPTISEDEVQAKCLSGRISLVGSNNFFRSGSPTQNPWRLLGYY